MSAYRLRFSRRVSAAARAAVCGVSAVLLSTVLLAAVSGTAEASSRSLKLYNNHTGERIEVTYKRNGNFIPSALRDLNRFLRDWRRNEITKMDPDLFDLVWDVYRQSGSNDYIHVVSGYRSPATNNMLRGRSRGVAKTSQHMRGKAMDFFIPGANLANLRAIGLRKQIGGVGYYPTSGSPFVHMDTGNVRHWPRMTRKQLARVFPDGKTIHVPSDGKPMPGYKQALAELKAGGSRTRQVVVASASPNVGGSEDDDDAPAIEPSIRPSPVAAGGASGGGNVFASLFGKRESPTPPSRIGRDTPEKARVTPPAAIPGVKAAEPEVAKTRPPAKPDEPEPAVIETPTPPEPVLVATMPPSKPARAVVVAAATPPADAIGAIAAVVDAGKPAAEPAPSPALGYASSAPAVPVLRPRPAIVAGSQLAPSETPQPASLRAPLSADIDTPATAPAAAKPAAATPARERAVTRLALASATDGGIASRVEAAVAATRAADTGRSLSGRIPPRADPFARFPALPGSDEPRLISGDQTTRTQAFADLRHPDQRRLANLLDRPSRLLAGGFQQRIYGALRTDRFDGPAVVSLPVLTTD